MPPNKKKRIDPSKAEDQLYKRISRLFDDIRESLRYERRKDLDEDVVYEEHQIQGHTLYIVGEHHHSRKQVDYIHEMIAPRIKKNPQKWLILSEDANKKQKNPKKIPSLFYIQELAAIYGLPYVTPLASFTANDTREYIYQQSEIESETIDRVVIEMHFRDLGLSWSTNREVSRGAMKYLGQGENYIRRILSMGPLPNSDLLLEIIISNWNDYSKGQLPEKLGQYPTRSEVLVSAGSGHLPVFR